MVTVELQLATEVVSSPAEESLRHWIDTVANAVPASGEIVIRLVDELESQSLNSSYRGKHNPTNVLAFPSTAPEGIPSDHIGDLVICAPVVLLEAQEQQKLAIEHWAHMVVHGMLHLLGYDHANSSSAKRMEGLEIDLLAQLGYPNPYD